MARLGVNVACGVLVGCGSVGIVHPRVAPATPNPSGASAVVRPARWFPLAGTGHARFAEQQADGTIRIVEQGMRLVEHPDGAIERAPDLLPPDGALSVLDLPARLGGGLLFSVSGQDATVLWRASGWTSPLRPLVRLPFTAARAIAGFDRLYVVSGRTSALIAIDLESGRLEGLGAVPSAPAYGGLAFSDGWLGAVEVDLRGVLVTFDAGSSWNPLGVSTATPGSLRDHSVVQQDGRIVVNTTRGAFALEPTGKLDRVDGPGTEVFRDFGDTESASADDEGADDDSTTVPSPLGGRPLETAVLRGLPDSPTTALVLAGGIVSRVSLEDGRLLDKSEPVTSRGATCQAVRLGRGIGFVCGEDDGPTRVFAAKVPLGVAPVLAFDGPRFVASSGNGALVVRGGCGAEAPRGNAAYCIVPPTLSSREVRVVDGVGTERVVALADGRAAVVVPPRPGASGSLSLVGLDGKSTTVPLSLDRVDNDARLVVEHGEWLDGMIEAAPGVLGGFAAASGPFVGLTVALDGKVSAGVVEPNVERASFSGSFAFTTDGRGAARETTDGGLTWSEVAVPDAAGGDDALDAERGCTPVGCSLGSWLRVGWGSGRTSKDLVVAADPPNASVAPAPFVSWAFSCVPTGESEGPKDLVASGQVRTSKVREHYASPTEEPNAFADLQSSAFRPFLGVPSPQRTPDDLAFDFGTEDQLVQLRSYAWGPRSASWDHAGTWIVRAADRFRVRHSIWSTAPSRPPWVDAGAASEAFGSEPTHRVTNEWSGVMDPVDDGGVVMIRTGTASQVALVERDRAITMVGNADDFALDRPSGAVKVLGKWYLGAVPGPRTFQLLGLDAGTLSSVRSFPRLVDDAFARVVRTERGDALGVWVIQRGRAGTAGGGDTWFVYAVDPNTGDADEPLVIDHEDLAHPPAPCAPEDDGWVLVRDLSASIARVDFQNVHDSPSVEHLEAKLVASRNGLCIESMAGQVEGDPPKDLNPRGRPASLRRSVDFVLSDRATDRRWGFRCTP